MATALRVNLTPALKHAPIPSRIAVLDREGPFACLGLSAGADGLAIPVAPGATLAVWAPRRQPDGAGRPALGERHRPSPAARLGEDAGRRQCAGRLGHRTAGLLAGGSQRQGPARSGNLERPVRRDAIRQRYRGRATPGIIAC